MAFLLPSASSAATFGFAQDYSIKQGESAKSGLYAAGANVTIVGSVVGDAMLAGGNIFVGDTISENATLFGGTVNVVGTIGKDLRIASGKSLVRGNIGGDLVSASGNLQVITGTVISGDVNVAGGSVQIDGEVMGGVNGVVGALQINGVVHGSVNVTADTVVVGPNAVIDGSLVYSSTKPATLEEGAMVKGENTFTQVDTRTRTERLLPTLWGTWIFIKFIVLMVSALLIQAIFKSISDTLVYTAIESPGWSVVRGFVLLVASPFALALVTLTFIGIPFVVLGAAAYILLLVLAYLFSPIVIGAVIFKLTQKSHKPTVNWKSIVTGVCAFMILSPLGWFGTALQSLFFLLTLGAIFHALYGRFNKARE